MADLYLAEAAANGFTGFAKDSLTHVYYDQVFKIHKVTPDEYEQNLRILAREERRIEAVVSQAIKLINPKEETTNDPEE